MRSNGKICQSKELRGYSKRSKILDSFIRWPLLNQLKKLKLRHRTTISIKKMKRGRGWNSHHFKQIIIKEVAEGEMDSTLDGLAESLIIIIRLVDNGEDQREEHEG